MCENIESEEDFFSCESSDEEEQKKDIIKITFLKRNYLFNKQLYENIIQLPNQLRNKLYIYAMRNFWREYIPNTAKVPMWYNFAVYQKDLLFKARQNNIHFMHLPCNTLPQNMKYIIGCQCKFCTYECDDVERIVKQANQVINPAYFHEIMPPTDSKWNCETEIIYNIEYDNFNIGYPGYPIFNPNYDIEKPLQKRIKHEQLTFTSTFS